MAPLHARSVRVEASELLRHDYTGKPFVVASDVFLDVGEKARLRSWHAPCSAATPKGIDTWIE